MYTRRLITKSHIWTRHSSNLTVKIVTYNVLSSSLSEKDWFINNDVQHLDPKTRFAHTLRKLESIRDEPIICLQEVSKEWADLYAKHFKSKKYSFIHVQYGHEFNGYMGTAIAFPNSKYQMKQKHFIKIGDVIAQETYEPHAADWELAVSRVNTMIYLQLKCKYSLKTFGVSTYHMPCRFDYPKVMIMHIRALLTELKRLSKGHPYVIGGDFNTLPDNHGYTLLTKGMVHPTDNLSDEGHSHRYPTSTICGLNSAYMQKNNKEPDFTNYADPNNNSFMGTIDYVFLSKPEHHSKKQTWYVESVKSLPTRQKGIKNGTLPNQFEPSDHLLLWATLKLI